MAQQGKPKLADAMKTAADENLEAGRPEEMKDAGIAAIKNDNAQVNEGIDSNKERLIDIGRGHLAAGRRPKHD